MSLKDQWKIVCCRGRGGEKGRKGKGKGKGKQKQKLSKQLEQEQNHRNGDHMEGYQWGGQGGEWRKLSSIISVSILISTVLNSASDRLAISLSLSLFLEF